MSEGSKTDAPSQVKTTPADSARQAKDSMTRAERIFVRINIVQTILAVAGVFTGAVALYAALNESAAVRRQSAAAVWPYVQLVSSDYLTAESAEFKASLTNAGVGPARVQTMRVRIANESVADWREAVARLSGDEKPRFAQAFAIGRVLRPGETVEMISTSDRTLVRSLQEAINERTASVEFCYCSIFSECWVQSSLKEPAPPEPVKHCPDFGAEAFQF